MFEKVREVRISNDFHKFYNTRTLFPDSVIKGCDKESSERIDLFYMIIFNSWLNVSQFLSDMLHIDLFYMIIYNSWLNVSQFESGMLHIVSYLLPNETSNVFNTFG